MKNSLLRVVLRDGRAICASPLPKEILDQIVDFDIGDETGYFLYEEDPAQPQAGIEILAKAASYEAAFVLIEMLEIVHFPGKRQACNSPLLS